MYRAVEISRVLSPPLTAQPCSPGIFSQLSYAGFGAFNGHLANAPLPVMFFHNRPEAGIRVCGKRQQITGIPDIHW
jgi:hypothetical protein